ncbi:Mitochondrial import inner membrane translocase subunit TIM50 [Acorus calamus]|uniref:Mitochondrial import inner membrane translocase subunit TIM50 n=1 Tax=Acorus calamus TaxID=4465 RepID=A0AAV9FUT0_ACOCL|nr:Mitochondrial import inner membrane translocase subunit TIM50 [Acorus calamus]KAK1327165.1 Mitochondrial import inner membrane translocase subunit TIM50 [Acorus calamus]
MEAAFAPILGSDEAQSKQIDPIGIVENDEHTDSTLTAVDESDDGSSSSHDYQICNISKSSVSDARVITSSFNGSINFDCLTAANYFLDYDCMDLDKFFDTPESFMVLPDLEETVDTSNVLDEESTDEATINPDNSCLYLALHQMESFGGGNVITDYSYDQEMDFDPQFFFKSFDNLSEVVQCQSLLPAWLPDPTEKRKNVTLVLDLDETLVHSSLEQCDDADFTFPVFLEMREHMVYVKRRPHLQMFLERVAQMFDVVIFTASQSIYAEPLLDILDPEKKLISQRMYRESCIFSDGNCTKDLTVLGLDLSKVAIVDNSPQVFRLQVNNGIPITSWFDDQSDQALVSLLPFLETLVHADDVRPLIAKRFSNED